LQEHGYAIVFDSARSLRQLKHYAECYGAVGVVAEYGAAAWDAISGASCTLVSAAALDQLEAVKTALRQVPGVFVNADYRHSIRAHVYERGARTAVPSATIASVLARLGAGELRMHDTATETTIVPRAADKGSGLTALLELAGARAAKVAAAVGDSAADLAMFAVAERSFAPGHINCRNAAESLGCRVAGATYQNGFLESARAIVHPGGERCDRCAASTPRLAGRSELFARLLEVVDRPLHAKLLAAVAHPAAVAAFKQ
jgi:hydroxymethylpyrimidine pyrophosphatase-like HAD family hydrolase